MRRRSEKGRPEGGIHSARTGREKEVCLEKEELAAVSSVTAQIESL
jgi:hypothetical protein